MSEGEEKVGDGVCSDGERLFGGEALGFFSHNLELFPLGQQLLKPIKNGLGSGCSYAAEIRMD